MPVEPLQAFNNLSLAASTLPKEKRACTYIILPVLLYHH